MFHGLRPCRQPAAALSKGSSLCLGAARQTEAELWLALLPSTWLLCLHRRLVAFGRHDRFVSPL